MVLGMKNGCLLSFYYLDWTSYSVQNKATLHRASCSKPPITPAAISLDSLNSLSIIDIQVEENQKQKLEAHQRAREDRASSVGSDACTHQLEQC